MAAMQTTMIRASITAYSTAVGPSSAFRNSTTRRFRFDSMFHTSFRLVPTKGPLRRTKFRDSRQAATAAPGWTKPFGSLAIPLGPMALRPTLAGGLPLSRNPDPIPDFTDRFDGSRCLRLTFFRHLTAPSKENMGYKRETVKVSWTVFFGTTVRIFRHRGVGET